MAGSRRIEKREKVKATLARKKEEELVERQKGVTGTLTHWDLTHVTKVPLPGPPAPARQRQKFMAKEFMGLGSSQRKSKKLRSPELLLCGKQTCKTHK